MPVEKGQSRYFAFTREQIAEYADAFVALSAQVKEFADELAEEGLADGLEIDGAKKPFEALGNINSWLFDLKKAKNDLNLPKAPKAVSANGTVAAPAKRKGKG